MTSGVWSFFSSDVANKTCSANSRSSIANNVALFGRIGEAGLSLLGGCGNVPNRPRRITPNIAVRKTCGVKASRRELKNLKPDVEVQAATGGELIVVLRVKAVGAHVVVAHKRAQGDLPGNGTIDRKTKRVQGVIAINACIVRELELVVGLQISMLT